MLERDIERAMRLRERVRAQRDAWRAAGRCTQCGEPRDGEDAAFACCWRCRERAAGRYMAYREMETARQEKRRRYLARRAERRAQA